MPTGMVKFAATLSLSLAIVVEVQAQQPPLTHAPARGARREEPKRDAARREEAKRDARHALIEQMVRTALEQAAAQQRPVRPVRPSDAVVVPRDPQRPRPVFPPPADAATDERWRRGWEERAATFETIDPAAPSDEQKLWAMKALREEAAFLQRHFARTEEPLGEAYGAYYIDLTLFVTQLKDPRSVEALAVATDVAPSVSTTLAELGEEAVAPVLAMLDNPMLAESSAYTLGKFLQGSKEERSRIRPESVMKIRGSLLDAAATGKRPVRKSAIRALRHARLTPQEKDKLRRLTLTDAPLLREVDRLP